MRHHELTLPRLPLELAPIGILVLTFVLYSPALGYPFLQFDDSLYVTNNSNVLSGLNSRSIGWAFTSVYYFYHPLTWLSLISDAQMFKTNPFGFHLTNLFLHLLNVLLVHSLLGQVGMSHNARSVATLIFAIHPLNVETVCWISERKGLLAATFLFSSVSQWFKYLSDGSRANCWLSFGLFVCSLLAKPIALLVPFAVIACELSAKTRWTIQPSKHRLPIVCAAVASIVILVLTFIAESRSHATEGAEAINLLFNVQSACVALSYYLERLVLPFRLSPIELRPVHWSVLTLLKACCVIGVYIYVYKQATRHFGRAMLLWPAIALSILLPSLGLVGVGNHYAASRYAYVPALGLIIPLIAMAEKATKGREWIRPLVVCVVILWCGLLSNEQRHAWASDRSLFEYAVKLNPGNYAALANLGHAYMMVNCDFLADFYLRRSNDLNANNGKLHLILAQRALDKGDILEALDQLWRAPESYERAALVKLLPECASAISSIPDRMNSIRGILGFLEKNAPAPKDFREMSPRLREVLTKNVATYK
jgi:protein O-mannosyl-transferase